MDLQLASRWGLVLGWCLLVGAAGCRQLTEPGLVIDFDLREFAYADTEGAAAHRAGVEQRSALRLIAGERLYLTERRLRVDVVSETLDDPGDEGLERARSVIDYDWERGLVWSSTGDEPATRQSLAELDYESENRYRRNRLDFVTAYVESPEVREASDAHLFLGDGRTEESGTATFGGLRATVYRIAVFPGAFWDVWVLPSDVTPFESAEEVRAYLVGGMGVPPSRASRLVERLGGVPVKITATLFAGVDSRLLVEGFLRDVTWQHDLPIGPDRALDDDELDARLEDLEFLLGAVRRLDQLSSGLTPTAVFLRLSEHMDEEHLDTALEIFRGLDDAYAQIELARSLLRWERVASWRRLREVLFGERGGPALNVVEALVAEADARALSALLHVLRRAEEFVDLPAEIVLDWGLSHVRVLSGMSLAELVEYSGPGAIPDGTLDRSSAARSAELDRWFRWWETKQTSVPRF